MANTIGRRAGTASAATSVGALPLETPVLLLIFNRPDTTRVVMESLRAVRPSRLYVAADGPRADVNGESARCADARAVAIQPDWECEITTRIQHENVGLGRHVSSSIDWFYEHEQAGIVLEDDCVPHPTFFRFCTELLEYYRNDSRVMHISGNNFQYGRRRGSASYYYSKYPFIWGWATWKRAWQHYDFSSAAPEIQASTWDTQWLSALERQSGVAIIPNVNLVTNIGFGEGATHTTTIERYSMLPAQAIQFPLQHPRRFVVDKEADTFVHYSHFRNVRHLRWMWLYRLWDLVLRVLKRIKKRITAIAKPGGAADVGRA